jgi:hypothetical protein
MIEMIQALIKAVLYISNAWLHLVYLLENILYPIRNQKHSRQTTNIRIQLFLVTLFALHACAINIPHCSSAVRQTGLEGIDQYIERDNEETQIVTDSKCKE